ncbi:NADH dehydrogenase [ubiquinone] 1 alpha subcomplex assembly factor 3 [Bradysia coprophila]|uniref:NADH dehydrogenase [ubiquinone] 1 alpha subcomplex assembly factor 3 n=1 Tax=Bradysia coprophila TaxID=38358 RepID=UPI00187DD990|nr:NADH dehydrogenase [ubiquinone] 1 alpha subcomplex assembly factor 3 [Bradysia coprophila]
MFTIGRKLLSSQFKHKFEVASKLCRQQITRNSGAYHGDGKTKVNILNQELDLGLMINTYSQDGFRLNNGLNVIGPMAIFPRTVMSWNIATADDINEESLSLFQVLDPKIEILVIGIGDTAATPALSARINAITRKLNINVEVLGTDSACATFNFLNAEQRLVAGAMIPPTVLRFNENDVLQSKLRQNQLYQNED